jgi:hypothetical protein
MRAAWKALLFLLFTADGVSWAGEMRTWTIWDNQTVEAKTVAFERRSLKFSKRPGEVLVNGIAYSRLKPLYKKVVDLVVQQHGFDDLAAVLAEKDTPVKELKYVRVDFRTKEGETLSVPLGALAGADEQTGDYKLAHDEALLWFKAHEERPQSPAANQAGDNQAADAAAANQAAANQAAANQAAAKQAAAAAAASQSAANQAAAKQAADAASASQAAANQAAAAARQAAADAKKRDDEQKRAETERKKRDDDRKREEERKRQEEEQKKRDAAKKK